MNLLGELHKLPADTLLTGSADTIARGDVASEADILGKMLRYPGLGRFLIDMESGLYFASPVPNPDMSVAGASRVILGIVEAADIQEAEAAASEDAQGRLHEALASLSVADYDRASEKVATDPIWLGGLSKQREFIQGIPAFRDLASNTREFSNTVPDFRDAENLVNGTLLAMQYVIEAGAEE